MPSNSDRIRGSPATDSSCSLRRGLGRGTEPMKDLASLATDGLERLLSGSCSLTSRSDQSYSGTDSDLNLY
jgi:hypothetical protein